METLALDKRRGRSQCVFVSSRSCCSGAHRGCLRRRFRRHRRWDRSHAGGWDQQLAENPEAFYSFTPWRFLDGSQDVSIHVMVAENSISRSVAPEPESSWLSDRHFDIDLPGALEGSGYLARAPGSPPLRLADRRPRPRRRHGPARRGRRERRLAMTTGHGRS